MVQSSETSLASIGRSLQKIASIMETLNENLVAFAKQQEKPEVTQMPASSVSAEYYQDLTKRVEGYSAGMPSDFGEHVKKEGE